MLLRGVLALLPEVFAITGGILKLVVLAKSEKLDPDKKATIVDVDADGNVVGVKSAEPMPTPSDVISDLAWGTLGACAAFDTSSLKDAVRKYRLMDKERKDIFWLQMASYGCTFMTAMGYRARHHVKERERLALKQENNKLAADNFLKDFQYQALVDRHEALVDGINTDISKITQLSSDMKLGRVVPHESWSPTALACSVLDTEVLTLKELLTISEAE
jgi:hypothetical protein